MIEVIWRTKDGDQPVIVLDYLGEDNMGRYYVSIEGSNTGVPIDELYFVGIDGSLNSLTSVFN